jgi:type IV pilus assembly protein PilM
MPYMNDEEMQNALKYEAAKYIPFEVEDMILDYQRLKDEPVEGGEAAAEPAAKEMRILLAAAKRDFVNDHANQVEALGLVPTICDVDAFAIGNAYELSGSIRPDAFDWTKVAALVDIGATKTNVNIVKGDVSYFTREIYIGGDEMTDALTKKATLEPRQAEQLKREPRDQSAMVQETVASVLEDLCHEIHLSLDYFENQFDRPVDEIRISGGASLTTGLDDAFEKTFSRKPIHWNPVECLEIDGSRVDSQQVNDHACQFAVVVGLAARVRSG